MPESTTQTPLTDTTQPDSRARNDGAIRSDAPPPPRWSTQALMLGGREAEISHEGKTYRLRITAMNRLILTK